MKPRLAARKSRGDHGFGTTLSRLQEMHMKWQTPQAQDMRFGFEITMYVAAR